MTVTLELTEKEAATLHHFCENEILRIVEADWEGDQEFKQELEQIMEKIDDAR